jgi:hypothetical protein
MLPFSAALTQATQAISDKSALSAGIAVIPRVYRLPKESKLDSAYGGTIENYKAGKQAIMDPSKASTHLGNIGRNLKGVFIVGMCIL